MHKERKEIRETMIILYNVLDEENIETTYTCLNKKDKIIE